MPSAMRVIVVASQKGGAGKTTLAGHLAVEAELAGNGPVALIDTDPQGSLATWWNARDTAAPAFVRTDFTSLFHDVEQLREAGFRIVVIDTPPAVTRAIAEVVSFADLVVLPTRPSPHDLRAVGATVDIIEAKRKQMIFVVNGATPRARITSEAAVALSQHGTVAPVTIHHRVDFAASMIDGRTVMETDPSGSSSKEIKALWDYIATRLEKISRETVQPGAATGGLRPAAVVSPAVPPSERPGFGQRPSAMAPAPGPAASAPAASAPASAPARPAGPSSDQPVAAPARRLGGGTLGRPSPTFGRRAHT